MAKGTQLSFNGGEFTEHMAPRVDVGKYHKGCKTLENFYVLPYGGAMSRPGTVHGGEIKDSSKEAILIPFVFSTTTTMDLELGEGYMRVWRDQSQVMSGGSPYEIITPYTESDLPEIQYEQVNDVVYLTHPSHQLQKLTRLANDNWTLEAVNFIGDYEYPPLEEKNSDKAHTMSFTGDYSDFDGEVTITASHDTFGDAEVGEMLMIGHDRSETEMSFTPTHGVDGISDEIYVMGDWAFQTAGRGRMNADFQESEDRVTWKTKRNYKVDETKNILSSGFETTPKYMRVAVTDYINVAGDPSQVIIECSNPFMAGLVEITEVISSTEVVAKVIEPIQKADSTYQWARQYFRKGTSYPRSVCIHKERLCLASTDVWLSQPGNYGNFRKMNDADSGFRIGIQRSGSPRVNWMQSLRNLRIGTNQAEAVILAENNNEVFAYDNFTVRWDSSYGSKFIRSEAINGTVFFLQPAGRTLRHQEITGIEEYYDANTLTTLADHILGQGVRQTAYQRQRYPTFHAVRTDGELASLVYERSQNIQAWYRTVTDGEIESVSVTPMPDEEDRVALIVKRSVDGADVRHVEFVALGQYRALQDMDSVNMWFVDDGVKVTGDQMTTVAGLDHLEGVSVAILADGAPMDERVVSGGSITLDHASDVVIVGRPYDMTLIPMNVEGQGTMGRPKSIAAAIVKMWRSGRAEVRVNDGEYSIINWAPEFFDEAPELFTGDSEKITVGGDWDRNVAIEVKGRSPVPINVQAITLEYEMGRG